MKCTMCNLHSIQDTLLNTQILQGSETRQRADGRARLYSPLGFGAGRRDPRWQGRLHRVSFLQKL